MSIHNRTTSLFACCAILLILVLGVCARADAQILPPLRNPLPPEVEDSIRTKMKVVMGLVSEAAERIKTIRQNASDLVTGQVDLASLQKELEHGNERLTDAKNLAANERRSEAFHSGEVASVVARIVELSQRVSTTRDELAAVADGEGAEAERERLRAEILRQEGSLEEAKKVRDAHTTQAAEAHGRIVIADNTVTQLTREVDVLQAAVDRAGSNQTQRQNVATDLETVAKQVEKQHAVLIDEQKSLVARLEGLQAIAGRTFFPITSDEDGHAFFGTSGVGMLRNVEVSLNTESGGLYTELLSDFAGPVRLGIGVTATSTGSGQDDSTAANDSTGAGSDSTSTDPQSRGELTTIRRFLSGGGNLSLNALYVGMFERGKLGSVMLNGFARTAIDVPSLSTSADVEGMPFNFDGGLEAFGTMVTSGNLIRITFNARALFTYGNKAFQNGIGRSNGGSTFGLVQTTIGLEAKGYFSLVYSRSFMPSGISDVETITVQVAPL